jgi:hypothetical protein
MKVFRMLALLGILAIPASYAQAQRVVVGVGVGAPYRPAPVCEYGYYNYAPYACAPYGYYGPSWFSGGVFIGAGPWFHGFYGRRGFVGRPGFYGRPGFGRGFVGRGPGFERGFAGRGPVGRGFSRGGGFGRGPAGSGFHGGARGGFHGGGGFRGGHR